MTTVIIIVLLGVLVVFLLYVSTRPATFSISRQITIAASSADVFPHINNLTRMQVWSPWKKLDPDATYTFSGPPEGVGSSMEWSGNKHIGAGRQTIVSAQPTTSVVTKVEFFRPFKGESDATMTLVPKDGATLATWSLSGKNNFFSKLFCVFVNQDKMLGGSLEDGLDELRAVIENSR